MNRWKVQNVDYDWADREFTRLKRFDSGDLPWEVTNPDSGRDYQTFATHAEAITYADKQARRTA